MSSNSSSPQLGLFDLRPALFGGLGGSLGATLGWFVFVGLQELREVLFAVLIGVIIGLLLISFKYYRDVAIAETKSSGAPQMETSTSEVSTSAPPRKPEFIEAASVGALVALVLALVCENIVTELITKFFKPFAASVVTMFPVGAIFSLEMRAGALTDNSLDNGILRIVGRSVMGAMIGASAGGVALVFYFLMTADFFSAGGWAAVFAQFKTHTPPLALLGWWALIGVGFALAGVDHFESSRVAPLGGVLLSLGLVFIAGAYGLASKLPVVSGLGTLADQVLATPDLPAQFWKQAEGNRQKELDANLPSASQSTPAITSTVSDWNWLARCIGCENIQPPPEIWPRPTPPGLTIPTPIPTPIPYPTLAPTLPPPNLSPDFSSPNFTSPNFTSPFSSPFRDGRSQIPTYIPPGWERNLAPVPIREHPFVIRKRKLCESVNAGWQSGLWRSWLVMMGFAVGLGCGRYYEKRWRPLDYPSSRTRQLDRRAAVIVALVMLIVIALVQIVN